MRAGFQKYFIAIVPPEPILGDARAIKEYFRDHYQSAGALNSPPHITLHMPFEWKEGKEDKLIDRLSSFAKGVPSFDITLNGFGCFPPRVIFIDVAVSQALMQAQKELVRFCRVNFQLFNADYRDIPFHPHMTVAFRDLRKPDFQRAWDAFSNKKFEGTFSANRLTLLRHDGKKWNAFREFFLA